MKIVVVGGAGLMGPAVIADLLEQKDVSQIVVADIKEEIIKERVAILGDERLTPVLLDLSDEQSAATLFRSAAAVANIASYAYCVPATRAALEAGVNYLDLGALSGPESESQLALSDEFKQKGITAILGMGGAPGMVNVLSRYIVNKLDSVESIEIRDYDYDTVPDEEHSRPLYASYSIDTVIDEFSAPSLYFDNGELREVPPRSYPEVFRFSPPVGDFSIATSAHPEPATLSQTFKNKGIKHVSWKLGFMPHYEERLKFVCALGLASREPINVQGQMVSPRAVLMALLKNLPLEKKKAPDFYNEVVITVKGVETGEKVEYTINEIPSPATDAKEKSIYKRLKIFPTAPRTGTFASIVTLMLARGQIEQKGVFLPEEIVPPELFIEQISQRGHITEISRKTREGGVRK